ncbi:MAG: dihydropteroate synthase, partial [Deferribacterota bacterium]|nr:dihydropteroate synthase [Deferribacterota bacterium]
KPLYATENRLRNEIKRVGVDPYAEYLINKGLSFNIRIKNLRPCQANIIKQEALAVGIDAAVARDVVSCSRDISDVCLFAHIHGLTKFVEKLKKQPFGLKDLALEIEDMLFANKIRELKLRDVIMPLNKPKLMGILNTTPDSFSDGGLYTNREAILGRLIEFKEKGVDIVDIGGESTRPYSKRVSAEKEWSRIAFAVEKALELGLVVSVDTYKSEVAAEALKLGVHMINDISGMGFDKKMAEVVARYNSAICLMHIKGVPETMQDNPSYEDVVEEIYFHLEDLINKAISAGISKESIIVDPGFGFGKKLEHNLNLLKYFWEFSGLKVPLLVGISRKGFVGKLLGNQDKYRVLGSKLLEMLTLLQGASIIRAHDIDESKALIELTNHLICDD